VLYKLFLLFILVPLVELTLLLMLAGMTRWYVSLAVVILSGLVGAALAHHQGFRTMRTIRSELSERRMPTDALIDGAMILAASLLLLTPGVLTDLLGMTLLIPAIRSRFYKPVLKTWFKTRFPITSIMSPGSAAGAGTSQVVDSYVVDSKVEDVEG